MFFIFEEFGISCMVQTEIRSTGINNHFYTNRTTHITAFIFSTMNVPCIIIVASIVDCIIVEDISPC